MSRTVYIFITIISIAYGVLMTDKMKAKISSGEHGLRAQMQKRLWTEEEIAASDFKDYYFYVEFEKDSDESALESLADSIKDSGYKIRHKLNRRLKMLSIAASTTEKANAVKGFVDSKSTELGLKQHHKISADEIAWVTTKLEDVNLWNLDRLNAKNLPLDGDMSYEGSGVGTNIFVLDTGIDFGHQEFANKTGGNIWDSYSDTILEDNDVYGHGTHCAGTAAGVNVGMAPGANLYGLKVLSDAGFGFMSEIIAGIEYVIELYEGSDEEFAGVKSVISMSLGGSVYTPLNDAVAAAFEAGILVVSSAGNGDKDNSCKYSPASEYYSLTVGATDSLDNVAYFSSTGSCVNVFAPGQTIHSACNSNSDGPWGCGDEDSYVALSGTSMAAPLVAGLAALYWEKAGDVSNTRVARGIVRYAFDDLLNTDGSYAGTENRLANGKFV